MKRIILTFLLIFAVFAEENTPHKPFILSLSGGGARGIAHIGVLKYFEEVGIVPDTIAGTSMGAIVGTLFACGYSYNEIDSILRPLSTGTLLYGDAHSKSLRNKRQKTMLTFRFNKDFGIVLPKSIITPQSLDGVMGTSVIAAQISSGGDFDKLPIPLRIFTTNLSQGGAQMHKSGDILQIAKASFAVPGLIPPVKINDDWHIDGGLRANIPVLDSAKNNNNFVFAVDVSSEKKDRKTLNSLVDVVLFSVEMGMKDAEVQNSKLADMIISPVNEEIKSTDFYLFDELVEMGYLSAKTAVENSPQMQQYKNNPKKISPPPSSFEINTIKMAGLQRTREWYLRNVLDINLSKPMDMERVEKFTKLAEATDYFESFHITGHEDTLIAVVEEKERRSIGVGIRYDNYNLAEVLATPRYDNVLGLGVSAGASFQVGFLRKKMLGEAIWTIPIRQSFNWYLDFNGYISSQRLVSRQIDDTTYAATGEEIINYSESDITKNGLNLLSGFEFANSFAIFGGFRMEKYKSRQSGDGDVNFAFTDGNNRINMLIFGVDADYRNDSYFPSEGGKHRFWFNAAGNEWGSGDKFFTINGFTSFVFPVHSNHTLIPLIYGTWADRKLPSAMRYYIGGGRYEEYAASSDILYEIPFAGVQNRELFADNFFMFELLWRYQPTLKHPLYLSLFIDAGNLWNYDQNSEFSSITKDFFTNIPVGVEAEIALRTVLGHIRFSWSRILAGEFSENFGIERNNVFNISIGFDF